MIGKIISGSSFRGLIHYITDPQKQQWSDGRHLMGTEPSDIIQEMDMVANRSRATQPVYHISVSWSHKDDPSKFEMLEVADRVLKKLNMERNQALIVSHKNTRHPHIHMAINRVDPETFKAVDRWNDMRRLEGVLREIEKEKGWQETPGTLYGDPDKVKGTAEKLWETKHREKVNDALKGSGIGEPDYQTVRARSLQVKKDLYSAKDWQSFDEILAGKGLWVESKGAGMVMTDGAMSIKASSVARDFSRGKLEKKFSEPLSSYEKRREQHVNLERGVGNVNNWAKAIERIELEGTKKHLERHKFSIDTELRRIDNFDTHLKNLRQRINEGFEKTFHNPVKAQRELARVIEEEGLKNAGAELVSDPRRFGKVKLEGWMLQQLGNAISEMDQKYKEWETYLEAKIMDNPQERSKKRKALQEKQRHLSNVKIPAINQELRKNMRESEAGYAFDRGTHELIAISRAIHHIMKDPKRAVTMLLKQGIQKGSEEIDRGSEAGRAINQAYNKTMMIAQTLMKFAGTIKSGGLTVVHSSFRHSITQSLMKIERERTRDRGRDFGR